MRKRSLKPIALTILIVLLSSLLNLSIALGFWWFGEGLPTPTVDTINYEMVDPRPRDLAVWRNRREPDWPPEPVVATRHNYLGITYRHLWEKIEWSSSIEDAIPELMNEDNLSIDIVESGWPLRCIAGERLNEWRPPAPIQSTSGMFVAFGARWPNRVLWLGMVMNEVFYGAVIVLAFVGWIRARRAIRRRRGRCPQCAYDLRDNSVDNSKSEGGCPECGWRREAASHNVTVKRRLFTLAIFLLLGAVLNIVVAWGCILIWIPDERSTNVRMFAGEEAASLVNAAFDTGAQANPIQCDGMETWRLGWSETIATFVPDDCEPGIFIESSSLSAGWPAYSLCGQYLSEFDNDWYEYALMLPDVLRPLGPRRLIPFLPLRPLWPGFAVNTIFYAGLLWLPFAPVVLRGYVRRRCGRCLKCGYDLRGNLDGGCPECGWQRKPGEAGS